MTVEQICTSLEISKQLKEAGYEQESLHSWHEEYADDWKIVFGKIGIGVDISAPTASEILEKLPKFLNSNGKFHWEISLEEIKEAQFIDGKELVEKKIVEVFSMMYPYHAVKVQGKTFVEMLAKMWFYLKENNLLKESL